MLNIIANCKSNRSIRCRERTLPGAGGLRICKSGWPLFLVAAALVGVAPKAAALEAKNFSLSEYFAPPKQTNLQLRLSAAAARPLPGNQQLLTKGKLESFKLTGERELLIDVPECIYDQATRTVGSAGPLQVQSGDGRFRIAGDGFAYRQGESRVVISNRVHAVVELPSTNAAGPLEITSHWFEFDKDQRRGAFHDEVRGGDTNFDFTCGRLSVSAETNLLATATNKWTFSLIESDGALEVVGKPGGKQAGRRAAAQHGVYRRNEQMVELTGDVQWQLELNGRSGRSDRLTARPADGTVEAVGNVALKSPRALLGAAGSMLNPTNTATAPNPLSPDIELLAARCTFRTNEFVNEFLAEGGVRLLFRTNQLACDRLEARGGTPQIPAKTAIATGHVIVSRAGGSIVADRADYAESDGTLVFTGEPHWQIEQKTGVAERLTIRTHTGEVFAENKVKVTVPLGPGTGSFLTFLPNDGATNRAGAVVEVFADSFLARTNDRLVTFSGDVRMQQLPHTGSEPKLRCEELELRFSTNTPPRVERLEARRNVVYEQGMPGVTNGPARHFRMSARSLAADTDPESGKPGKLVADGGVRVEESGTRATGDQAVYTIATDTFKLTGKTELETPQMIFTESPEVYWGRAEKRFVAREPCVIKFKPGTLPGALKKLGDSPKLP